MSAARDAAAPRGLRSTASHRTCPHALRRARLHDELFAFNPRMYGTAFGGGAQLERNNIVREYGVHAIRQAVVPRYDESVVEYIYALRRRRAAEREPLPSRDRRYQTVSTASGLTNTLCMRPLGVCNMNEQDRRAERRGVLSASNHYPPVFGTRRRPCRVDPVRLQRASTCIC